MSHVVVDGSGVSDDDVAQCIINYTNVNQRFNDLIGTHGISGTDKEKTLKLLERGRDQMNEYYTRIKRECHPFITGEEYTRRYSECRLMMRNCDANTSHDFAVTVIAQMEDIAQSLCVLNALPRGKGSGMGGFAKSLFDNGRIPKLLCDRLHEVAQFRNKVIGHDSVGSGKGVTINPAKTLEFLRLYLNLLNESTANPIMGMEEEVEVDEGVEGGG